jgi:hypothetical protein
MLALPSPIRLILPDDATPLDDLIDQVYRRREMIRITLDAL